MASRLHVSELSPVRSTPQCASHSDLELSIRSSAAIETLGISEDKEDGASCSSYKRPHIAPELESRRHDRKRARSRESDKKGTDEMRAKTLKLSNCEPLSAAGNNEGISTHLPLEHHCLTLQQSVSIPDSWGMEQYLRDWAEHGCDEGLQPAGLMVAQRALIRDCAGRHSPLLYPPKASRVQSHNTGCHNF
eukprot:c23507_g1_i2 orf=280-852(+)